jgi:hypothetical protein
MRSYSIRPGKVALEPLIFLLQRHRGDWKSGAGEEFPGDWPEEVSQHAIGTGAIIHHQQRRRVYFSYPDMPDAKAAEFAIRLLMAFEKRRAYYQRLFVGVSCRQKHASLLARLADLEDAEREDFLSRKVDFIDYDRWREATDPVNQDVGIPSEAELAAIPEDERKAYTVHSLLRAYAKEIERGMMDEELLAIMAIPEDSLIRLHLGFGTGIRNLWCLTGKEPLQVALRPSKGGADPDHVSQLIIHAIWRYLTDGRLDTATIDALLDQYGYPLRKSSPGWPGSAGEI